MWRLITHTLPGESDSDLSEQDLLLSFGDELRELRNSQSPEGIRLRAKLTSDVLTPLFNALSYPHA